VGKKGSPKKNNLQKTQNILQNPSTTSKTNHLNLSQEHSLEKNISKNQLRKGKYIKEIPQTVKTNLRQKSTSCY